jgi:hypothetical protein
MAVASSHTPRTGRAVIAASESERQDPESPHPDGVPAPTLAVGVTGAAAVVPGSGDGTLGGSSRVAGVDTAADGCDGSSRPHLAQKRWSGLAMRVPQNGQNAGTNPAGVAATASLYMTGGPVYL